MPYSIGEFARLCGINATTLRAWQRRYGLLKPLRTDGGHRLYSDDDVQQALKILDWVKKGVPVSQVKPLLSRPGARRTNNWLTLQETMLQRLKEGKIESLRQLIYDAGREYPRQELVTEVLRPLRSQVSANVLDHHDAARNSRRHHHRLYLVLPRRRQEGARGQLSDHSAGT